MPRDSFHRGKHAGRLDAAFANLASNHIAARVFKVRAVNEVAVAFHWSRNYHKALGAATERRRGKLLLPKLLATMIYPARGCKKTRKNHNLQENLMIGVR